MASFRHSKQDNSANSRNRANGNTERLKDEKANQKKDQHDPAGSEGCQIFNRFCRCFQESQVVSRRNIFTEEQMQHHQRGDNSGNIHWHHYRGILSKAQSKEVRRDYIHQVRHDKRQAGSIGNKTGSHDECQRCAFAEP